MASDPRYVRELATVLEEELRRLRRWIPLRTVAPVDVDLFPALEFLRNASANVSVVGYYDGRMRVPFADLGSLHPDLVAILSHELSHALVGQYTRERAPRWFEEGLAQHIQMVQEVVNPVPELRKASRLLSFPVVEAILGGFAEEQFVELAYAQAAWAVHYVEAARGVEGIHRLLDAFAAGQSTDAALGAVLGVDRAAFDRGFWDWSERAPQLWPTKVRRYDLEADRARVTTAAADDSPVPRLARETRLAPGRSSAQAMAAWHAAYAAGAQPVKQSLAPVVRAVRSGQRIDLAASCAALEERVRSAEAGGALQSPDPRVRKHLESAYARLRQMATACRRGEASRARAELDNAERDLAGAAAVLATYGLTP